MAAAVLKDPLLIEQGATWDFAMVWKTEAGVPVDLSNCQARMQFRQFYESSVLLDLDSSRGSLTIDVSTGRIATQVSSNTTARIKERSGVFDLEVYHPNGRVDRVLQGKWTLSPEVTR